MSPWLCKGRVASAFSPTALRAEEQRGEAGLQSSMESCGAEHTSNSQRVAAYPYDALDCDFSRRNDLLGHPVAHEGHLFIPFIPLFSFISLWIFGW